MENKYLSDDEVINYEDTLYLNPRKSLEESSQFIDNLRNVQNQNNAQIATDTYNLGTDVPSNLGGLGGGRNYFESRYSVPQGVALANNLRATANAAALNEVLQNEMSVAKQKYNNAYKNAQRRAALASASSPSGDGIDGGVEETSTGYTGKSKLTLDQNDMARGGKYVTDPVSGNITWSDSYGGVDYSATYVSNGDGTYTLRDDIRIDGNMTQDQVALALKKEKALQEMMSGSSSTYHRDRYSKALEEYRRKNGNGQGGR